MSDPYQKTARNSQRQVGGNTVPTGEVHDSKKAETITEDRFYSGAEDTTLENSTGRASSDVKK